MNDDQVRFARTLLERSLLRDDIRSATAATDLALAGHLLGKLKLAALEPDTNDFDTLINLAAQCLYEGEVLPGWLAAFAADVLTGKRVRPTRRGADKYRNYERDYCLWRAAQEVAQQFKLPLYSNNELSAKTTAAKVVGQAANLKAAIVTTAIKRFERASGEK